MERLLSGSVQSRPGDSQWDHNDMSGFMESMYWCPTSFILRWPWCRSVIPAKVGTYAAWVPAFEAVIQFPPANLRLQNGHVRIASVDKRIANSTTSLEKQPPSPPDFGSIGAKARSWNWITASKAGTYAAWVPAFTLGDSHISKTYV